MEIVIEESGEVRILKFQGKLDTNTAPKAEAEVFGLIESGASKLLVDFEQLDYVSSAGLRFLLATAKKLKSDQGVLKICGLNPTVQEVFDISGFSSILSVFSDQAQALSEF